MQNLVDLINRCDTQSVQ